ncbi:hypothetical protein diail_2905 [Diaporthe ilicicola]|nr:hypothetical protein diail_2905 [Diaporthe ilicicola]
MVSAGLLPSWISLDRRADICGVKGYDRDRGNYFWSASKQLTSYSGCSARCAKSSRCKSFGFNDEACMLFDLSLSENFDEDRHSDVKYYDVGCVQESQIPPTANGTFSLTRTTTVSTAVRTITRSISLATGTGGPLQPTNGTGFFPVTRTAASNQITPTPASLGSDEPATSMATTDASAAETSTPDSSGSGSGAGSQLGDGILPPSSNITLANNGTNVAPNTTIGFNSTGF